MEINLKRNLYKTITYIKFNFIIQIINVVLLVINQSILAIYSIAHIFEVSTSQLITAI